MTVFAGQQTTVLSFTEFVGDLWLLWAVLLGGVSWWMHTRAVRAEGRADLAEANAALPVARLEERLACCQQSETQLPSTETDNNSAAPVVTQQASVVDDLEAVEGIGPKTADRLHEAGIGTFVQLGELGGPEIRDMFPEPHFRQLWPSMGSWPEQARLLAAGDAEGFRTFTDSLVAGRDINDDPT